MVYIFCIGFGFIDFSNHFAFESQLVYWLYFCLYIRPLLWIAHWIVESILALHVLALDIAWKGQPSVHFIPPCCKYTSILFKIVKIHTCVTHFPEPPMMGILFFQWSDGRWCEYEELVRYALVGSMCTVSWREILE